MAQFIQTSHWHHPNQFHPLLPCLPWNVASTLRVGDSSYFPTTHTCKSLQAAGALFCPYIPAEHAERLPFLLLQTLWECQSLSKYLYIYGQIIITSVVTIWKCCTAGADTVRSGIAYTSVIYSCYKTTEITVKIITLETLYRNKTETFSGIT